MPTGLLKTFLQRLWPEDSPFLRLARHFLVRLARSEQDAASSEIQLGVGALLGLLSVPGAATSFIVLNKYSSLLDFLRHRPPPDYFLISVADKYLFICLAMGITGIVTVLKWDKILPDAQDYLNLAPLPIRPRSILLANAAAIAIAVVVFAIDVNSIPGFLFPMFVTSAANSGVTGFLYFAGIHALCVLWASVFTFCAVFACLGAISAVLPRELFRAYSWWLRGIFLVFLLTLLASGVAGPSGLLRSLRLDLHSPVRFLPSLWFLGLYQNLQHRGTPVMLELSSMVVPASLAAVAIALLSYGLSYRRRFAAALEGERRPMDQRISALVLWLLDRFAAGTSGFQRACYRFTVRAMLRNETHRMCISVAIGIGWLVGSQEGIMAAPFVAAYFLVLGLRIAFDIPAGASAAWVFRAILDQRRHETLPVARRIMLAFLTPLVFVPGVILAWWKMGPVAAVLHGLYLLALGISLAEIQLAAYRKIPLTCPMPGFRDHLFVVCLIQFLGFQIFTNVAPVLETWMLAMPVRLLLVPMAMTGSWWWNQHRLRDAREAGELQEGLSFDNIQTPEVERLNL